MRKRFSVRLRPLTLIESLKEIVSLLKKNNAWPAVRFLLIAWVTYIVLVGVWLVALGEPSDPWAVVLSVASFCISGFANMWITR